MRSIRMKDPVRVGAEVVSCHAIRTGLISPRWSNAVLELEVSLPGATPYRVRCPCNAPTQNWPQSGGLLPVTVDRADPSRVRVHWDGVLMPSEAAALARMAALRESAAAHPPAPKQLRLVGLARLLRGAKEIRATTERF